MRGFSDAEYRQIIEDLFFRDPASSESLLAVVDKVFSKKIKNWCYSQPELAGRGFEEDILQDLKIKVLTQSIPSFFLRRGHANGINENPDEFAKWLNTVANNLERDYLRRQRVVLFRTVETPDDTGFPQHIDFDRDETEEAQALLASAFHIVLESDSSVYIVLTWIASFLFIYNYGIARCRVSQALKNSFENSTLNEMKDWLLKSASDVPWLSLSPDQIIKLDRALKQKFDGEQTFGQTKYSSFFMKSGGKSSISNWNNRMNNLVRRVIKQ